MSVPVMVVTDARQLTEVRRLDRLCAEIKLYRRRGVLRRPTVFRGLV